MGPDGLTDPSLVVLGVVVPDAEAVIGLLVGRLAGAGRITDETAVRAAVVAREARWPTGLPGRVALPHARSAAVLTPSLALARVASGVDFGGPDGPATLVVLLAAPPGPQAHLAVLAALARRLVDPGFRSAIMRAPDPGSVAAIVNDEVTLP